MKCDKPLSYFGHTCVCVNVTSGEGILSRKCSENHFIKLGLVNMSQNSIFNFEIVLFFTCVLVYDYGSKSSN